MTDITGRSATEPGRAGGGLLDDLDADARSALLDASAERHIPRGGVLWLAGGESKGLFVILEGRVRVLGSRGGRQHLVHVAGPGSTMGEVPLFDGGGYPATAVAVTDVRCLVLPPTALRRLLATHPSVAETLLTRLSRRVRVLVERLDGRTLGTVRARVAASLLGMATGHGGDEAEVGAPQHVWAEDLGTVREVLARELKAMKDEGLVEQLGPGRYRLLREAELEAIAGEAGGA